MGRKTVRRNVVADQLEDTCLLDAARTPPRRGRLHDGLDDERMGAGRAAERHRGSL